MRSSRLILVALLISLSSCCDLCGSPQPPPATPTPVEPTATELGHVEREVATVWHDPTDRSEYELTDSAALIDGDLLRTSAAGKALLKFQDVWMRLYHDGEAKLKSLGPDHTEITQQTGHALYGMSSQGQAQVTIKAGKALVEAWSTVFCVIYDSSSETALVRPLGGDVRLCNTLPGGGVDTCEEVPPGYWSTVVAGQEPTPPRSDRYINSILLSLGVRDVMEMMQEDVTTDNFVPSEIPVPDEITPLPLEEEGVTELTMGVPTLSADERELIEAHLARFTRQTGVQVELREVGSRGELYDMYFTMMAAGMLDLDVIAMDMSWAASFYEAGGLVPLQDYISDMELDTGDFFPGAMQAVTYQGELVALPWDMNVPLLYYRRDFLEEYGVSPPRTYGELTEQAQELSEAMGLFYGYVWAGNTTGSSYEPLSYMFVGHIAAREGEVFTADGEVVVDSPEATDGLRQMLAYIEEGASSPDVTGWLEEDALEVFRQGEGVFVRAWPYAWTLVNEPGSPVAGNVGVTTLLEEADSLAGDALAVGAFSETPVEASWLVAFLTETGQQQERATRLSYGPTRRSVYERTPEGWGTLGGEVSVLWQASERAVPLPVVPEYGQVSRALAEWTYLALVGEVSPEEATAIMAEQLTEITQ